MEAGMVKCFLSRIREERQETEDWSHVPAETHQGSSLWREGSSHSQPASETPELSTDPVLKAVPENQQSVVK